MLLLISCVGGADTGGLVAVNAARFQILDVDVRCDIRTFVQREGLIFKPGRGFYEFTKPEKISDKKEVVLVDKVSHQCVSISYRYLIIACHYYAILSFHLHLCHCVTTFVFVAGTNYIPVPVHCNANVKIRW